MPRCEKCDKELVHTSEEFWTCTSRDKDGNPCRGLIGHEAAWKEHGIRDVVTDAEVEKSKRKKEMA